MRSAGLVPADAAVLRYTHRTMEPIYTTDNTKTAYQLNWSEALFAKSEIPYAKNWIDALSRDTESDGVRVLEHSVTKPNVVQFLVSTQPTTSPSNIIRSVKGRLQYLLREIDPKLFRLNYSIQSVGDASAGVLDRYVANQTDKHPMADPRVQASFEILQFHNPQMDLAQVQTGSYGQFLHSLQVVLEFECGWHEVSMQQLTRIRTIICSGAKNHSWPLARIGLLSNHLHLLIGADVKEAPSDVALAMMNNVAHVYDMKPVLKFSYYVGTFGNYDRAAVRQVVAPGRHKAGGAPNRS